MLRNYFKTTLRNLSKNLSHTIINVLGLTLGISGSIIIYLVVIHMTSYDGYHKNGERIYRVVTQSKESTGYSHTNGVPVPLPEAAKNFFSEFEKVSFVSYQTSGLVTVEAGGKANFFPEESGVVYLDSVFYQIFDRKWLQGDPKKALREPNTVVLSERFAKKYFGDEDAIGKSLRLNNEFDLKVSGVVEDYPDNTHFPFDLMMSYETVRAQKEKNGNWGSIWSDEQCYVLLAPGVNVEKANARFPDFVKRNYPQTDNFSETAETRQHWLQPISELHFDTRFSNYIFATISKSNLIAISVIGIFLLLTAAINFINLATAVAVNRSREVGVRKVLGSTRVQLAYQFFGETFFITLLALLISIGVAEILLVNVLNPFLDFHLKLNLLGNPTLVLFLMGLVIAVSLLSGLYPSLLISGFKPVQALKNTISSRNLGGFTLRRSLVGLQFFITQFLIICTIVIIWQTSYLKKYDMGFTRDAIALVDLPVSEWNKTEALIHALESHSGIKKVSASAFAPASGATFGTGVNFVNSSEQYSVELKMMDENYLELYDIKLITGKPLVYEDTSRHVLVNETFVKHVGMKSNDEILGHQLRLHRRAVTIDGVVKDFHTHALGEVIQPVILEYRRDRFNLVGFSFQLSDWEEVKKYAEEKWKAQFPEYAIHLRFMDDDIADFYDGEERISKLISSFCAVAILIGCLGLYGLIMFMAKMKTKEVGIRKTLGASVFSIVNIFSWEFTRLVLIAFVVAAPCAWWVMSGWLSNYSYRIDLGWQVFLGGLVATFTIAFLTVAHRSVKSALANPVDSLRVE